MSLMLKYLQEGQLVTELFEQPEKTEEAEAENERLGNRLTELRRAHVEATVLDERGDTVGGVDEDPIHGGDQWGAWNSLASIYKNVIIKTDLTLLQYQRTIVAWNTFCEITSQEQLEDAIQLVRRDPFRYVIAMCYPSFRKSEVPLLYGKQFARVPTLPEDKTK